MQETNKYIIEALLDEKKNGIKGRLYHHLMVKMTYNSNHIEGSILSEEETRLIFETKTISLPDRAVPVDNIIETVNHFRAIDYVLTTFAEPLDQKYIQTLHRILKQGTMQAGQKAYTPGEFKTLPNEVGGMETVPPEKISTEINALIENYNRNQIDFDRILDFHVKYERIHPFQDGNGRTGRLILLKECLRNNIIPFIIHDEVKFFYYRGLKEWFATPGFLTDTCLTCQDHFKKVCTSLRIPFIETPAEKQGRTPQLKEDKPYRGPRW